MENTENTQTRSPADYLKIFFRNKWLLISAAWVGLVIGIVLPQAIRVVLPPVGNEFIMLLKDTSLVSVVAVADLTRRGREFMAAHFNPLEVWTLIALIYLILTLVSARFIAWLEKKRKY